MLKKGDLYYPTKEFKKKAWVKDKKIYKTAEEDPVKFWEKLAQELFWFKKWQKPFEHTPPYFKWFLGGKINITSNIFENSPQGWEKIKNRTALIWEPEPTDQPSRIFTYQDLLSLVSQLANALKNLGVKKGDRIGIYLPMVPEVIISMLACARIGAIHTVVFSAFSSHALQIRLQDTGARVLITADGYYRKGEVINLKKNADEAVKETNIEKIIVKLKKEDNIAGCFDFIDDIENQLENLKKFKKDFDIKIKKIQNFLNQIRTCNIIRKELRTEKISKSEIIDKEMEIVNKQIEKITELKELLRSEIERIKKL